MKGQIPDLRLSSCVCPPDKTFVVVLSNLETAPVRQIAYDLAALSFGEKVNPSAAKLSCGKL
jgi:hypothetical protein